jgi:CRP/FNR family transcriptional regulator, cyclic AMP receptor protein
VEETPAGSDGDFLAELPPGAAEELRRLGARRRFPAGAVLFVEGDPAHEALVLLSGAVKVSVGSTEGKEIVLEVFEAGALLGELSVIDGRPRSATVTALTPVEVLAVASGSFNDFLDRHPRVLRRLLVGVIGRLRSRVRHQLEFGAGDALGRVCARLADLADRYGEQEADAVVVHSPVNQSELASWTGLSREAVVKALRALRQLEWIDVQGRTFVVRDLDRLRGRATS